MAIKNKKKKQVQTPTLFWVLLSAVLIVLLLVTIAVSGQEPQIKYVEVYPEVSEDRMIQINANQDIIFPVMLGTILTEKGSAYSAAGKVTVTNRYDQVLAGLLNNEGYELTLEEESEDIHTFTFSDDERDLIFSFLLAPQEIFRLETNLTKEDEDLVQKLYEIMDSVEYVTTFELVTVNDYSVDEIDSFYISNMSALGWGGLYELGEKKILYKSIDCNEQVLLDNEDAYCMQKFSLENVSGSEYEITQSRYISLEYLSNPERK